MLVELAVAACARQEDALVSSGHQPCVQLPHALSDVDCASVACAEEEKDIPYSV